MSIRAVVAVAAFLSPTIVLAAPAPEKLVVKLPSAPCKYFALVYRAAPGVSGQVKVNDVPAIAFAGKGSSGSSNEVQGWLLPGANRVDVVLDKVPTDEKSLATVSLHGLAEPGFPEDANQLWKIVVPQGTAAGARAYTFELPDAQAPPGLLWKKAQPSASLTDADKKEIRDLAAAMLTAIQKADVAAAHKLWAFSLEERARSTYSDPKDAAAAVDRMIPAMQKVFGKAKLAPSLAYTLVAGGRVVRLTGPGGAAPIAVAGDDGSSSLPVSAAKIDGRWTLVP